MSNQNVLLLYIYTYGFYEMLYIYIYTHLYLRSSSITLQRTWLGLKCCFSVAAVTVVDVLGVHASAHECVELHLVPIEGS